MKEKKEIKRVFNFSGGKTSAYMTIKYHKPGDIVIFCDTGREHPKTYKFINDFEAFENIPVIRISMFEGSDSFGQLLEKKDYKLLPNRVKRFCTDELKIKTAKRYLKSIGIKEFYNFIGFRSDEPLRVIRRKKKFKKVHDIFPLFDDGINKQMINNYWETKPYNLEIPSILGNCTLCFMKGKNNIITIMKHFPELAEIWINDEEKAAEHGNNKIRGKSGRTYFPDISYKELFEISKMPDLFDSINLEDLRPAFDCACTT